jgi:hypothetical protein
MSHGRDVSVTQLKDGKPCSGQLCKEGRLETSVSDAAALFITTTIKLVRRDVIGEDQSDFVGHVQQAFVSSWVKT